MKKSAYILLFIILILQSGGLMFMLHVQQSCIRYEMGEKLNSSVTIFEKLELSVEQYKAVRIGSHEIRLNRKMYDVKSSTVSGDQIELLVIEDTEEESIVDTIKRIASGSSNPNQQLPQALQKLISLVYLPSPSDHSFTIALSDVLFYPEYTQELLYVDCEEQSPPPRKA